MKQLPEWTCNANQFPPVAHPTAALPPVALLQGVIPKRVIPKKNAVALEELIR